MQLLENFENKILGYGSENITPQKLHNALAGAVMADISSDWEKDRQDYAKGKRAAYLSAEFLVGRAVYNNLLSLGITDEVKACFEKHGFDFYAMEEIADPALGNGGLGRLAACYLDSAAAKAVPLDGYGLRYQYGLFRQSFRDGLQYEEADTWGADTDPWSVRREEDAVEVTMAGQTVRAVPYDMPVIGYGKEGKIGRLRLWQAEAAEQFDFDVYKEKGITKAFSAAVSAKEINALLYPEDGQRAGKVLRLKQQYFFSDASLKDMLADFEKNHGKDFAKFPDYYIVQLNDTHPVSAIPDFIHILINMYGYSFDSAFDIAAKAFAYTNHTIMPEALEKWNSMLYRSVLPEVYEVIKLIDQRLEKELAEKNIPQKERKKYKIIANGQIHMARLAVYAGKNVNGVSEIHTQILKDTALCEWNAIYPHKFVNVTNGVTQRRWLALCNPELAGFITELLESDKWLTNLEMLADLRKFAGDSSVLERFGKIKQHNKENFAAYINARNGVIIDPNTIFDVQIKRIHEYKRQFLGALGILDLYFAVKNGEIKDMQPITFLFGGKAAPGYVRAKGIIKFINEIAKKINADPQVRDLIKVYFVPDYNVSIAEKIIPAADFSEQISTAGTEASGTGNMKLSLNGAVTIGTYDGANIEIFRYAGIENNYVFGARVEDIAKIEKSYDPAGIYESDAGLKRAADTLIDGTFDDGGTGAFAELHSSLLKGASWHTPDHYYLFEDFASYRNARLDAVAGYKNRPEFLRKAFLNTAGCGNFSADRSVLEYAEKIWGIKI